MDRDATMGVAGATPIERVDFAQPSVQAVVKSYASAVGPT